jgi:hypothetical protein
LLLFFGETALFAFVIAATIAFALSEMPYRKYQGAYDNNPNYDVLHINTPY